MVEGESRRCESRCPRSWEAGHDGGRKRRSGIGWPTPGVEMLDMLPGAWGRSPRRELTFLRISETKKTTALADESGKEEWDRGLFHRIVCSPKVWCSRSWSGVTRLCWLKSAIGKRSDVYFDGPGPREEEGGRGCMIERASVFVERRNRHLEEGNE